MACPTQTLFFALKLRINRNFTTAMNQDVLLRTLAEILNRRDVSVTYTVTAEERPKEEEHEAVLSPDIYKPFS